MSPVPLVWFLHTHTYVDVPVCICVHILELLFFMHLCVCVCISEGTLECQELELQAVVSHVIRVLGTELWSSGRAASTTNHWANSPALLWFFFLMKLYILSSDDGSHFPYPTFPIPPSQEHFFRYLSRENRSVLHGLICYCFLLETKTQAYLENRVNIIRTILHSAK